jgi:hypothetical protein
VEYFEVVEQSEELDVLVIEAAALLRIAEAIDFHAQVVTELLRINLAVGNVDQVLCAPGNWHLPQWKSARIDVVRILLLEVLIPLELSAKHLSCTVTLNNDDNPMVCLDAGKAVQAAQRHATSLASRCSVAHLKVWTISVIFSLIPLLMLIYGVLLV